MVFGALYVKRPSFGDAFLVLMKDYGTILTGIPVLVAVVVAKQQLDANRRQHVATIKRSVQKELDALRAYEKLSNTIQNLYVEDDDLSIGHLRSFRYFIARRIDTINSYISPLIDPDLPAAMKDIEKQSTRAVSDMEMHIEKIRELERIEKIKELKEEEYTSIEAQKHLLFSMRYLSNGSTLDENIERIKTESLESLASAQGRFIKCLDGAFTVAKLVQEEKMRLSQYWS